MKQNILLALTVTSTACSPVLATKKTASNDVFTYFTAEGGVALSRGDQVCVMPPTQGVRLRTGEGEGKITVKATESVNIEASGKGGVDHEIAKLYEQSQSNLFFQLALYRLCEARANATITNEEYLAAFSKIETDVAKLLEAELLKAQTQSAMVELFDDALKSGNIDALSQSLYFMNVLITQGPEGLSALGDANLEEGDSGQMEDGPEAGNGKKPKRQSRPPKAVE